MKSSNPKNETVETNGNRNMSSISYSRKKIQISKKGIGNLIGFWVVGLNPHS